MLLVVPSNDLIKKQNFNSYLCGTTGRMCSIQNNLDTLPKMANRKPETLESNYLPHQDTDAPHNSTSETEEDDWNSEMDSSSNEEEQRIRSDPNYLSKVDYAIRLGYDESDLMTVLKKLGPEAEKSDVLLAELIKLFARTPRASEEPELGLSPSPESALEDTKVPSPNPDDDDDGDNLRRIVIDGSNVAMQHGNREVFSCKGIKYAVDYFKQRGHRKIVVFVPLWRKESPRKDAPITDQEILMELEKERILVFTPARTIKGRRVACYDDRYILKVAHELDGIVVSNDNYRDLLNENEGFRKVVEERLLMYSFMEDKFMPPDDPLGRHGPSLDNFLRKTPTAPEPLPPTCPYGKKCTYGNKCKYHHPERGNAPHKTVMEKLAERYKPMMQEVKDRVMAEGEKNKADRKAKTKATLARTKSVCQKEDDATESSNATLDAKAIEKRQHIEYNEKLNKLAMNINRSESAMLGKFSRANNNNNSSSSNNSSSGSNNNNNINSAEVSALSSHSPLLNLSNRYQATSTEPLVIGHLQLAKKLSDDATKDAEKKSMGASNVTKNSCSPTKSVPLKHSPQNKHSPLPQHLKVSRQYSITSEDDVRLKQNSPRSRSFVSESHYKPLRQAIHYLDRTQFPLVYEPMMPPMAQMQTSPEKFLSYPPTLGRQSSYPSNWMAHPNLDHYNQINLSPPFQPILSNSEQKYPNTLYEPVHPNPGTPVSFANTHTMPRAYMDPTQYSYAQSPISPPSMNYLPIHQTSAHHIAQQNIIHSPTRHVSLPSSTMSPMQEMDVYQKLYTLFPEKLVTEVLMQYPNETDPLVLCKHLCMLHKSNSTNVGLI